MNMHRRLRKYRCNAKLRRLRFWIATKTPKRLRAPLTPSKEMLQRCGKEVGENTYIYRLFEYYVDPNDEEVTLVVYHKR